MRNAATLTGTVLLALAAVQPFALQRVPTRLALELQDYAALPLTADNTNTNTRAQLARVNYMRDEHPAWVPCRDLAASTCALPKNTTASSTS